MCAHLPPSTLVPTMLLKNSAKHRKYTRFCGSEFGCDVSFCRHRPSWNHARCNIDTAPLPQPNRRRRGYAFALRWVNNVRLMMMFLMLCKCLSSSRPFVLSRPCYAITAGMAAEETACLPGCAQTKIIKLKLFVPHQKWHSPAFNGYLQRERYVHRDASLLRNENRKE